MAKMYNGVLDYTVYDRTQQEQQRQPFIHEVKYLGKKYDLSTFTGIDCNINQARDPDGSITATITRPGNPTKDIIKTDTTGKVVVQDNWYEYDKLEVSAAIDDNGIETRVWYGDSPGKNAIQIRGPDDRLITSVQWTPQDGSVTLGLYGNVVDDNDGDPTVATDKNGMKTTVRPFHAIDPYYIDVRNPNGSLKTQMILNSDGTVEPGSKWTTPAPVEPASK
jgi:hypothetical protein